MRTLSPNPAATPAQNRIMKDLEFETWCETPQREKVKQYLEQLGDLNFDYGTTPQSLFVWLVNRYKLGSEEKKKSEEFISRMLLEIGANPLIGHAHESLLERNLLEMLSERENHGYGALRSVDGENILLMMARTHTARIQNFLTMDMMFEEPLCERWFHERRNSDGGGLLHAMIEGWHNFNHGTTNTDCGMVRVAGVLLERGVDLTICDSNGTSAAGGVVELIRKNEMEVYQPDVWKKLVAIQERERLDRQTGPAARTIRAGLRL